MEPVVGNSRVRTSHSATTTPDRLLLSERKLPFSYLENYYKHACILSRLVDSNLLLLSEKYILSLRSNDLGKVGVLRFSAVCQARSVVSTLPDDWSCVVINVRMGE